MNQQQCPTDQQLEDLVRGTLSNDLAELATAHLGQCSDCQQTIEAVSVRTTVENEALAGLSIEDLVGGEAIVPPPSDSAYWNVLQRVSSEFQSAEATQMHSDSQTKNRASETASHVTSKSAAVTSPKPIPTADDTDAVAHADTTPTLEAPAIETQRKNADIAALPFLKPSDDPAYIGRLHHFEISRIIGRGGMGIVLEAFDTHLQRTVAIKILNPEYSKNDVARQRFCREGRAAAAIAHEHVVAMHQVAKEDDEGIAYLVMQYIEGDTLESRLNDGVKLDPQEAARIGMQIAAGLAAAHESGMVHRDIKPANILIEKGTERIKLTDFGLARASDDVRLTKTGMVTGTPLYMSPEQATGQAADERSDLFSLGAVLYEMLVGEPAFEAPSIVGVMKRIMDEAPTAPVKLNPHVPLSLSELTMALLEKKPERRPESATLVAQTLADIVTEIGHVSPLGVASLGSSSIKRRSGSHRLVSANTLRASWAIGILGLASLFIAAAVFFSQPDSTASSLADETPSFPSTVLGGNPGTVWSVDFDPSGESVVTAIEDGSVRLWDIDTQEVIKSFNAHRGIVWTIQYHPTRPLVATSGDDGSVKLWDANTLELLHEWKANSAVRKIAFSPSGTHIVGGDRDGVIHIWDIDSHESVATQTQPGSVLGVDWSDDGKLIASVGSDKIVRLWDAETLEPRQTLTGHEGPIYNVAFAPTGSRLATVGWGKTIHIWNTQTGMQEMTLEGSESDNWSVAFCSDGSHAVIASQDGKCRIWDLSDGKLVTTLAGHESAVHNVALDPSTLRIATSGRDGSVRVWDLSSLAHEPH